jgi:hypothetical protein
MSIDGNTACVVPGCGALISGPNNLCAEHRLPGVGVRAGGSTMVITAWYAEHGDEAGVILLNDLALGQRAAEAGWTQTSKGTWKHEDGRLIKKQRHFGEYETIDKDGSFFGDRVLLDAMGAKRVVADLEKTLESTDPRQQWATTARRKIPRRTRPLPVKVSNK